MIIIIIIIIDACSLLLLFVLKPYVHFIVKNQYFIYLTVLGKIVLIPSVEKCQKSAFVYPTFTAVKLLSPNQCS